ARWARPIVAPIEAPWRLHAPPTGHPDGDSRVGPPWEGPEIPGVAAVVVKPRSVADAYRLRARYRGGESLAVFPAEVLVELYATLGDARDLLRVMAVGTQGLVLLPGRLVPFARLAHRPRAPALLPPLRPSPAYR